MGESRKSFKNEDESSAACFNSSSRNLQNIPSI